MRGARIDPAVFKQVDRLLSEGRTITQIAALPGMPSRPRLSQYVCNRSVAPLPAAVKLPDIAWDGTEGGKLLEHLAADECRWPYASGLFCGEPGRPYCKRHAGRSSRPAEPLDIEKLARIR